MMLEAKDLTFYYRNRKHAPVIDHFDLTVAPGERVGPDRTERPGEDHPLPPAGRL